MNRPLPPLASRLLMVIAILSIVSACTKKDDAASLRVTMPTAIATSSTSKASSAPAEKGAAWNSDNTPSQGAELNCFAVLVGATDLTGNSCLVSTAGVSSTFDFKQSVGLLGSGDSASIEVPAGLARTIYVVGFKATTLADCRKNSITADMDQSVLSQPYLIASKTVEIKSGENEVAISPVLDTQKIISSCSFLGTTRLSDRSAAFGDKRDGTLVLGGVGGGQQTFNLGASYASYISATTATHTANGNGVSHTKVPSATRQISNVDATSATVVTLGSTFTSDEFEAGDEVLWHVSAGASSTAGVDDPTSGACGGSFYTGRYGTAIITSVAGMTITLDSSINDYPALIKNNNIAAVTGSSNFCRMSLTRVPNFASIVSPASTSWVFSGSNYNPNSGTGGIIALRTNTLIVNGSLKISAAGQGYTGGVVGNSFPGSSLSGPMSVANAQGNVSGGGSSVSFGGGGGAGGGEGGASYTTGQPQGGTPINYCASPVYQTASVGGGHACGLTSAGDLRCWGRADTGLIGEGVTTLLYRTTPTRVPTTLKFKAVSNATNHVCAIAINGNLYCWGNNSAGQVGNGTLTTQVAPTLIDAATYYAKISTNNSTSCGITTVGVLKCWGLNSYGGVGDGTTTSRSSPVLIDSGTTYASISVGALHTCGVTAAGATKCWGQNNYGQLGDGTTTNRTSPTLAASGNVFSSVSAGTDHTCGVTPTNDLKCWGQNNYGQLGDGTSTNTSTPLPIKTGVQSVSTGAQTTCVITTSSNVYCWGYNNFGQLGDGSTTNRSIPIPVDSGTLYGTIATSGGASTCGVTRAGAIKCWGANSTGQLGVGTLSASVITPGLVRIQDVCKPLSDGKAFFGGGGGSGTSAGGNGGGIVLIFAKNVSGTGNLSVTADGASVGTSIRGGGGGGGGTIGAHIRSNISTGTLTLVANGGNGGDGTNNGGGGGGGIVETKLCASRSTMSPTPVVLGGAPGGLSSFNGAAGAFAYDTAAICAID